MAQIQITVLYDGDDSDIATVLDGFAEAIHETVDVEPYFGVTVDGEHRDPDDPTTDFFS